MTSTKKLHLQVELALREISKIPGESAHRSWWIIRGVSIVESCIDQVLQSEIEHEIQALSKFGRYLAGGHKATALETWPDRLDVLKSGLEARMDPENAVQNFDVLVQLRNALIHGGGLLTSRQTKSLGFVLDLRKRAGRLYNVEIVGIRIDVSKMPWKPYAHSLEVFLRTASKALFERADRPQ